MKDVVVYSKEDIDLMRSLLDNLTIKGIQNCKNLAAIIHLLDTGISSQVKADKKEG